MMQDCFVAVRERHIAQRERERTGGEWRGVVIVAPPQRAAFGEQLLRAHDSRLRGLELFELIDDPLERLADELRVLEQHQQRADRDRSRPLQRDTDAEQQRGTDRERQVGEPHEQAADDRCRAVGTVRVGAHVVEPSQYVSAGTVGPKVLRRGEMLFEVGEEAGVDRARRGCGGNGSSLDADEEERRDHDEDAEREPEANVRDREDDERADEQQRAAEDVDEERDEEFRDRVHVAIDALDHLAGWVLAVVADVERQRVPGHLLTEVVRGCPCLATGDPCTHDRRALRARGYEQVQQRDLDELARARAVGGAVDEVADDDRSEQREHGPECERGDEPDERRSPGPHVGAQEPPWTYRSGVQSESTLRPPSPRCTWITRPARATW